MKDIEIINCNKLCGGNYEVFDRGKIDLIKKGNKLSKFLNLTSNIFMKFELSVARHGAAELKYKKYFIESYKVVISDNHRELSCFEILGTNYYLLFYDNCPILICGDIMFVYLISPEDFDDNYMLPVNIKFRYY